MKKHLLVLPFLLFEYSLVAQDQLLINTEGIPPITFYEGIDYHGHNQVWDVTQDERGLIYLAATYGLHEFDGTNWRSIQIAEGGVPRTFAKSESGRIYLGGNGVIGYLSNDAWGLTSFHSLVDKLPEGTNPGGIGFVSVLHKKVYFSGSNFIFVYDEASNEIQHFTIDGRCSGSFVLSNKVYFNVDGLITYQSDTLTEVASGNYFSNKAIYDFMVYGQDSTVALSASHEYHYFDGDTAFRQNYFVDDFLKDKKPYRLLKLSAENNAICYLNAGLMITDKYWNPVLHINESVGINQEVHNAFLDAQQNLWLATNFGVAVIELGSRYSHFGNATGIAGDVTGFLEEEDNLLVATTSGIYTKPWKKKQRVVQRQGQKFTKIKGSDIYNDGFLANSSPPLVRAYETIGQVIDGNYQKLHSKSAGIQAQSVYLKDSSYALVIGENGSSLLIFQHDGSKWKPFKKLENNILPEVIYSLKYDAENDLIWGANVTQLFCFNISEDLGAVEHFRIFSEEDGLPYPSFNFATLLGRELFISTKVGIYQFDASTKRFVKSDILGNLFAESGLGEICKANDSVYWYFNGQSEKGKLKLTRNGWEIDARPGKLLPLHSRAVYYCAGKGVLYGGTNTISFLQEGKNEDYEFKFKPLIRQLDIISGKDSIIFHGVSVTPDNVQNRPIELDYEQNSIRITYSVPYYRHPQRLRYQYQLEGFEKEWGEWTDKKQKEYTNLPAGNYFFNVRVINGFDTISDMGTIKFVIRSPWYEMWWAYLLYLLVFVLLIRLILYFNSAKLKAENKKQEKIIKERVKEIEEQKSVITRALEEKESLLKEIHHRVKNNLQIIASLLYLQSGKFENEDFKRVLEEGQGRVRSMALIHQKLYENDDLKSIPFEEYLKELVHEIKSSFGMHEIALNINAENIFFDVDTAVPLGLIINELATNSFKYAYSRVRNGSFSISLTKKEDMYVLNVEDNGKGLPEEIDIKKTKSLGLRLIRMLSQQLEGKFEFDSQNGTSFNLKFVA